MAIKIELGNKIRKLREEQGLSRGELCEGEEELTVRQLARIEAGESLPTLPKLEFIAERLSISVSLLVDRKYVELPKRYIQLKHKLYRVPTYNEEERVLLREECFTEIYERYYSALPEEEQLSIDVQKAIMDVHLTENADFGEGLLNDYFSQIINKDIYTLNDLLIIDLYFHCVHFKDYDEVLFTRLFDTVITQLDYVVEAELPVLQKLLLTGISVCLTVENYDKLIAGVKALRIIMQENQDFQKKVAADMFEGKYWLFSQKDKDKARQKYIESAQYAQVVGDSVLSEKVMKEWETDLVVFEQDFCQ